VNVRQLFYLQISKPCLDKPVVRESILTLEVSIHGSRRTSEYNYSLIFLKILMHQTSDA
jgi:hypothetical protein